MSIDPVTSSWGTVTPENSALRYSPEPDSSSTSPFGQVMNQLGGVAGTVAAGLSGIDAGSQALITMQLKVQQQMQTVSLLSNIYKSQHETQMSAVRNIRVG